MRQSPDEPDRPRAGVLTQAAFVLACALVIARATFLESVRDTEPVEPGPAGAPLNAGATTGLVFDLLLCLPGLLVLLRRAIDPRFRLRLGLSHVLLAALALLAASSALWASDKFAAAVTSAHLLAAAVLVWSMTQLVHSWLRLRLVAAMCFGVLLIYVANGAIYRLIDVPDNIKYWNEHKDEELRKRGWPADSFQARQFEQKIINGEMVGFNASPNTFAAVVVLLGVVCIGVVIQRLLDRDEPAWAAIVILSLLAAAWIVHYTNSKTALLTPLVAGGILAAIALAGPLLARLRAPLYVAAATVFLIAAAAVVSTGLLRGNLLAASLTFRWHYWLGAARVLELHPILGVGWGNFGLHYVGVRLPVAAEEVKDPHNLIVRAFVELGVVGGLLMLAWLGRTWWELTDPLRLPLNPLGPVPRYTKNFTARSIAAICTLAIVLNTAGSVDFAAATPDAGWFILLQLMKRSLFLGLLLLGYAAVALRSSKSPDLDDRPAPWILYALLAGLAAFLLHNLIDFSLFEPGAMGIFAALLGSALGTRAAPQVSESPRRPATLAFAFAAALWLAAAAAVVAPVAIAEASARRGDELIRSLQPRAAAARFRDASRTLWISNSDYHQRAALASIRYGAAPQDIRALLDRAIAANPMNSVHYRTRAQFEMAQPAPDPNRIIADYKRVNELDPNDVSTHLEFADALLRLGMKQHALDEYKAALRYNDLLDPNEPKRLPASKLQEIQQAIRTIEG
jgi:O-antigen ligase